LTQVRVKVGIPREKAMHAAARAPRTAAAGLVPKGQRALLRLNVQSTGAVDSRTGVRDGGLK
jgi:hypothetical protein